MRDGVVDPALLFLNAGENVDAPRDLGMVRAERLQPYGERSLDQTLGLGILAHGLIEGREIVQAISRPQAVGTERLSKMANARSVMGFRIFVAPHVEIEPTEIAQCLADVLGLGRGRLFRDGERALEKRLSVVITALQPKQGRLVVEARRDRQVIGSERLLA